MDNNRKLQLGRWHSGTSGLMIKAKARRVRYPGASSVDLKEIIHTFSFLQQKYPIHEKHLEDLEVVTSKVLRSNA